MARYLVKHGDNSTFTWCQQAHISWRRT